MEIIDISPVMDENFPVFPGDTPFNLKTELTITDQCPVMLSSLKTTLHAGAHADAPCHYHKDGESIESRDLARYIGACQVIEVKFESNRRITVEDIKNTEIKSKRILFKTCSFDYSKKWDNDFSALSPELIRYLKHKGVCTVGIDTPSVDPATSKTLDSHDTLYETDMAVLENLELKHVKPGLYTLVAPPLKIKGGDASPVRAVLLPAQSI